MMSTVEINKLKSIYYALLLFSLTKGGLILIPNFSSAVSATYLKLTHKDITSNITDGEIDSDELSGSKILRKWIDSCLLLEVLVCEVLPIEIHFVHKWPIRAYFILVWTIMHHLLSWLYVIYKILEFGGILCSACSQAIAIQFISAFLAFSILVWSRVLIQGRMYVTVT